MGFPSHLPPPLLLGFSNTPFVQHCMPCQLGLPCCFQLGALEGSGSTSAFGDGPSAVCFISADTAPKKADTLTPPEAMGSPGSQSCYPVAFG